MRRVSLRKAVESRQEAERRRRPCSKIEERIRSRRLNNAQRVRSPGLKISNVKSTSEATDWDYKCSNEKSPDSSSLDSDDNIPRLRTSKQRVDLLELTPRRGSLNRPRKDKDVRRSISRTENLVRTSMLIRVENRPRSESLTPLFRIKSPKYTCPKDISVDYIKVLDKGWIRQKNEELLIEQNTARDCSPTSIERQDLEEDRNINIDLVKQEVEKNPAVAEEQMNPDTRENNLGEHKIAKETLNSVESDSNHHCQLTKNVSSQELDRISGIETSVPHIPSKKILTSGSLQYATILQEEQCLPAACNLKTCDKFPSDQSCITTDFTIDKESEINDPTVSAQKVFCDSTSGINGLEISATKSDPQVKNELSNVFSACCSETTAPDSRVMSETTRGSGGGSGTQTVPENPQDPQTYQDPEASGYPMECGRTCSHSKTNGSHNKIQPLLTMSACNYVKRATCIDWRTSSGLTDDHLSIQYRCPSHDCHHCHNSCRDSSLHNSQRSKSRTRRVTFCLPDENKECKCKSQNSFCTEILNKHKDILGSNSKEKHCRIHNKKDSRLSNAQQYSQDHLRSGTYCILSCQKCERPLKAEGTAVGKVGESKIIDPPRYPTSIPERSRCLAVFQNTSDPLSHECSKKKRHLIRNIYNDNETHSQWWNKWEDKTSKRTSPFLGHFCNADFHRGIVTMQNNGSESGSSENGVDRTGWTVGLINGKFKYLTAETFGFKINANGASLKKKQLWTLEGSEHQVFLRSHLDRYLAVDQFGNVTCEAEDPSDPGCAFQIQLASDGSGRWALKNVQRGYFLGSSQDELKCTAKAPGEAEYWLVHLAARPQVNLRSAGRKRFAHLSAAQDEIHVDAPVPWGEDTLFTLEFRPAATADNDDSAGNRPKSEGGHYALHTCNNKYLARDGKLLESCTRDCLYAAEFHAGLLALRDIHGAYLAPIGSKAVLKSRSTTVTRDELFSLEESLPQASFVAALNQRYVSVKQGVDVTANQDEISGHETFQLEFDRVTKRWYIRTMQDRYWSLEAGGGIQASEHKRSSNALFDLVWQPEDGTVALRANNGKFLATKRSGHLYANADSPSSGDSDVSKYYFYLMNRPVLVLRCEQGFVGPKSAASPKLECNKAGYETIRVERCERGVVRFKGQNGKYWHADSEGVTVDADAPSDGFYLELREPSRICIKCTDGRYLTAGKNGALRLGETDYETATKWEF